MGKNYISILFFILIHTAAFSQGIPSREEAKIDQVYSEYGLSGKGVLTIIMDRGIDYRHPDFIDENGNTRLAYIFDMYNNSGANDPDNPFGFGTIYDSTEINTSLHNGGAPLTTDLFGHGTATTGIMAGNGSAVPPAEKHQGVAYQSKIISIIVTKDYVAPFGNNPGQTGQYNPNFLQYAFQFAKQKISELEMPSVTLLNIGSIQDPTDGSIGFCNLVSDYVANGNTFVCGVGDDGGNDNHMIAHMEQNKTTDFEIQKAVAGNLRFTAWYQEDDRFDFTIKRPGGQVEGPFAPPTGPADVKDKNLTQINIYHRGADVEFANSSSNLRQLMIDIFGENGTYTISLTPTVVNSDGRIDAFLNPSSFHYNNAFLNSENQGGNINAFSACPATLSPGDYVATDSWTDIDGIVRKHNGQGLPGEIWAGSSAGPTMDDRLGIDLVAPGEIAWAAYGEDSYYSSFSFNVLENSQGYYGIQTAVSAAAPIVTGVIALMLEVNPNLTPEEIKSILQQTAREDSFTGTTPNAQWGYGKLDALEAVKQTYQTVGINDITKKEVNVTISPNPVDKQLRIVYPGFSTDKISVSIYSIDGRKISAFSITSGEQVDVTDLTKGIYILRSGTNAFSFTKKFIKN